MKFFFILLMFFFSVSLSSQGQHGKEENKHPNESHHKKDFNTGNFIMDHILDSYSWHILGNFSVSLPVILYSKNSGWHLFFSNKFHHGTASYKNFHISHERKHKGKIVEKINGKEVRPIDLSITKTVTAIFFSILLLLFVFLRVAKSYKERKEKSPKGLQSWIEPLIIFLRDDIAKPAIGEHKYEKYMPFLLTLFFFIWFNNMIGIIPVPPFGANVTGNISVTLIMALFTFIITTISGNKNYWKHIFNPDVPWWLKFPIPLVPLIEFLSIFIKPFVLMIRLFANITAGHMIILSFVAIIFIFAKISIFTGIAFSPISVAFMIFISLLEILVAFIQAYVFTLLSALYFGMATEETH